MSVARTFRKALKSFAKWERDQGWPVDQDATVFRLGSFTASATRITHDDTPASVGLAGEAFVHVYAVMDRSASLALLPPPPPPPPPPPLSTATIANTAATGPAIFWRHPARGSHLRHPDGSFCNLRCHRGGTRRLYG